MVKKQKLNLIDELTTHKNDYKPWPLYESERPEFRSNKEPAQKPSPPRIFIDPQSHARYDPEVYVPFNLYMPPKPIVGTDPRECFYPQKPTESDGTQSAHLSSTLPPAVLLHEVEDKEALEGILDYTYIGLHRILFQEAALNISKRPRPPRRVVEEQNNTRFKPELYPPLPPGWIGAAKHWDCLQSRNLGDPFKNFWRRKGPEVECSCCCNPLPNMLPKEMKDDIVRLTCEEKLRLPYDITKTGYGGYRQICAKGVPLNKLETN